MNPESSAATSASAGALRALLAALRRHGPRRGPVPPAGLIRRRNRLALAARSAGGPTWIAMRAARLALSRWCFSSPSSLASAGGGPPGGTQAASGFELRPERGPTHTFSRTPAFAWRPCAARRATSSSSRRAERSTASSVFWSNVASGAGWWKFCRSVRVTASRHSTSRESDSERDRARADHDEIAPIRIPATSINLVLPWFTGKPYALYAHVRAVTTHGATHGACRSASTCAGSTRPPAGVEPGLVRWTPVEGATAYDVWYPDIDKILRTHTNVADQRDLYTFHLDDNWWQTSAGGCGRCGRSSARCRTVFPQSPRSWSPTYATTNPAWSSGS